MWELESEEFTTVKNAEIALLSSAVRSDGIQLASLLSEDFAEIGRSGRRWTYTETVAALEDEQSRATPKTSEWRFNRLSAELVLVNYVIHEGGRDSRHSSLWELRGPVLRFHQGTVVPAENLH